MTEPEESALEALFAKSKVDPALASSLVAEGWDLDSFRVCAIDLPDLDSALKEMFPDTPLSLLQRSQLRSAWTSCQLGQEPPPPASSTQAASSETLTSSSWHEAFPSKLDGQMIQQLKQRFLQGYPSEVLDADSMPSTRLLSLVYHQIQKQH
eukprot:s5139_g1.t1